MSVADSSIHGQWSGRWAFIMAATGAAVGLGNIWKFPYIVGENGGGAFVLVYLATLALVGVPVLMAEVMLGRRGRLCPVNTIRCLAREERASPFWQLAGWSGMIAGILILSFYSVIGGWVLAFLARAVVGTFTGLTADGVTNIFRTLTQDPERLLAWHTIFMAMTMMVVAYGVRRGIDRIVRVLMPLLMIMLVLLVAYSWQTPYFNRAIEFLFTPDFSQLTRQGVLVAMGHAFFTLSLGVGTMMMYGAYLPQNSSIAGMTVIVVLADTLIALLAGIAIFPLVYANGLSSSEGPGLVFLTLPIAFGHMDGGETVAILFFVMLMFAAWSSAIALIEPMVAYLVERWPMSRGSASLWVGVLTWMLGIGTVFSFNIWSGSGYLYQGKTFFELLDYLASNILLPLSGLLIALFAGWGMSSGSTKEEFGLKSGWVYYLWLWLMRLVAPAAIVVIFLTAIGLIRLT